MVESPLPFKAVVFDLDGTLLEQVIDFDRLRADLAVPADSFILDWIESLPEPDRTRAHEVLDRVEGKAAREALVLEGAQETAAWLRNQGIPFGILTRNSRATWERVRARYPFLEADLVATRMDGPAKPSPECLRPFLDAWSVEGRRLVHVGDFRFDLELARSAGMHSILIRPEGDNPFGVPCDRVVRNHSELLNYLKTLPFARS